MDDPHVQFNLYTHTYSMNAVTPIFISKIMELQLGTYCADLGLLSYTFYETRKINGVSGHTNIMKI